MRREYLWALVTLVIAVALAVLLLSVAAENSSDSAEPLIHSEYDKRLDRLDRKGVEAAYVTRVGLLFTNWMTDTTAASQERALKGHRNARKIYIDVMTNLDARSEEGAAEGFKLQSDTSTPFALPSR